MNARFAALPKCCLQVFDAVSLADLSALLVPGNVCTNELALQQRLDSYLIMSAWCPMLGASDDSQWFACVAHRINDATSRMGLDPCTPWHAAVAGLAVSRACNESRTAAAAAAAAWCGDTGTRNRDVY